MHSKIKKKKTLKKVCSAHWPKEKPCTIITKSTKILAPSAEAHDSKMGGKKKK